MKIVVIGGTGLVGSHVVADLGAAGHEALPASPKTGVDSLTGRGLDEVLAGSNVLVDVSNSPSFAADDVMAFFRTSTTNLLAAAARAGITHYVALSVVGAQRVAESPYLRAKVAQEQLIRASDLPYSLVQATQFFEFIGAIADESTVDGAVRLPPVWFQPMAARDVAATVAQAATGKPSGATVEIGGPERAHFDAFVRQALADRSDPRPVISDAHAPYFGAELRTFDIVPDASAPSATTTFSAWNAARVAA